MAGVTELVGTDSRVGLGVLNLNPILFCWHTTSSCMDVLGPAHLLDWIGLLVYVFVCIR